MKKILITILFLTTYVFGFSQVRTFLGPKGELIYDTTRFLNADTAYFDIPNDTTLSLKTGRFVGYVVKVADSLVIKDISGATIGKIGLSGSSQWTALGRNIYYNDTTGNVAIGTKDAPYKVTVRTDNILNTFNILNGIGLINMTNASAGNTQQFSPAFLFRSSAWKSSTALPQESIWAIGSNPIAGAGSIFPVLDFYSIIDGVPTNFLHLTTTTSTIASAFTASGIVSGSGLRGTGNSYIGGRLNIGSAADAAFNYSLKVSNNSIIGLPVMTTTSRSIASDSVAGAFTHNSTTKANEFYNGTRWATGISGSYSTTASSTSTFTITIGGTMPATYQVSVTPTSSTALQFYVTNKTSTTFDIVTPSAVTGAVSFDWVVNY